MQSGEWRATQGIERPPTFDATIALQTIRLTVPTRALGLAVRTRRSGSTATFDDSRRSRASLQCGHLDGNGFQLARRQLPQQGDDSLHVRLAHFGLLDESAHRRHDSQYPPRQAHHMSHSTDFANRAKQKTRQAFGCAGFRGVLAERAGFEPAVGYYPTHAFQACDLNHSSTSPKEGAF